MSGAWWNQVANSEPASLTLEALDECFRKAKEQSRRPSSPPIVPKAWFDRAVRDGIIDEQGRLIYGLTDSD